jgi:predicted RNA binding protein YcfA (HicA-like mRNA interferase family)
MTRLPVVSGRQCVRAPEKVGFAFDHQKGSHMILIRDDPPGRLSVPNHKELRKGMLRAIIRQAGLTVDEFVELL